jgi:hypothetical protein
MKLKHVIRLSGFVSLVLIHEASSATKQTPASCAEIFESKPQESNVSEFFGILKDAQVRRNESETSEAFEARMLAKLNSPYVVFWKPIGARYYADSEQMYVPLALFRDTSLETPPFFGGPYWRTLVQQQGVASESTYVGTNAFGVKKDINKSEKTSYGVAFDKGASMDSTPWPTKDFLVTFSIKPNEARNVKDNLNVVIIGSLIEPYFGTSVVEQKPTIDLPYDATTITNVITIKLECAAIVDKSSGKVLQMIK